jgi:mannonate dehydratase
MKTTAALAGSLGVWGSPVFGRATIGPETATGSRDGRKTASNGEPGIKLALFAELGRKTELGAQMGVKHAIVGAGLGGVPRDRYLPYLQKLKADYAAAGLTILGVESHPVPAEKIKLGLPGRDEEIENYIAAIRALSEVGIRMVCYNFMAGIGWMRTKTDILERGGALTSEFDRSAAEAMGQTEWGEVSEKKIWDNLEYFIKAVMPVAEESEVKFALHPDDPPISPLRGIGRILTNATSFRRVLDLYPSPVNGITFCQANFKTMGEDIEALAKEWCGQKKVFFVHFRDVEGTKEHFRETFHDNGPTDMARMLQVYHENGFNGPIRPDHAPIMAGEANDTPGYGMLGKIFAIGYMKGILDGLRIPYE